MEFNTGRQEWDQDYVVQATVPINAIDSLGIDGQPSSLVIRPQPRQVSSGPEPQISLLSGPMCVEIEANGRAPQAARQVKHDIKSNKSREWAEDSGLVTTRKSQQAVREANERRYLITPLEYAQHKFMGFFLWHDNDMLSGQDIDEQWDKIRVECHVFISFDDAMKLIVIQSDEKNNVTMAMKRLRGSLNHAEANERYCRPRYIVEPPSAAAMRKEVYESIEESSKHSTRRVELAGPRLFGHELTQWDQKRKELINSNEKIFTEHIKKAFARLCMLNSGMRMRVQFGHMVLSRYRGILREPGFSYDGFVKMMSSSQTRADFEKRMGGMDLGIKIIQKVNQSPKTFCPLDVMIGELSDIKPKQRIFYLTKRGSKTYRLEADIDISTRGEYQLGANAVFEEDTALKRRLDVGFFGFERFHWSLEILTKERLNRSSQAIQNTVRNLLSSTEIKMDSLGFPYPSLRPGMRPIGNDKADIHTVVQYKLIDHPYILEISLYRGIESEAVGNCGASMYSTRWDDHMGPKEGEECDRWELDSDLQALFPSSAPSSKTGDKQMADRMNGFRSFIATVEMVKEFVCTTA